MNRNGKIRLLQLVTGFSIGGAERKLLDLIKFIDQKRYDVTICGVGISGPLKQDFEATGNDVFLYTKKHKYDFSQVINVAKLMKDRKIDILMTTLYYADIIGILAALIANVPYKVSWEVSSHPEESEESKLKHHLSYRFCMKYVDKIISVSDGVKQFLVEERNIPISKIHTIHYGIDLKKFRKKDEKMKRKEFGFSVSDKIVGVLARLTVQKGHTYLIDAASQIIKKYPGVKFLFVGDGPLRSKLTEQIEQMNLNNHIHFTGFRHDVKELLNMFDLFLLPSLFEGLPNVILEAMACSLPIVATAVDGTPEAIIDGECGILIPPKEPGAIVKGVIKLLDDPELAQRLGKNARTRVENFFSNDIQMQKILDLYESFFTPNDN